jgi:hypothetical protein
MSLCMMVGLVACAQPDPPAPEQAEGGIELGEQVQWTAVDGAVEYRVQLWDGQRLLFEEVREQPVLAVTPVMQRSLPDAGRVELQVRAIGPDGRQIGEIQRRSYSAGAE